MKKSSISKSGFKRAKARNTVPAMKPLVAEASGVRKRSRDSQHGTHQQEDVEAKHAPLPLEGVAHQVENVPRERDKEVPKHARRRW
jgi:hypothetical protein